MAAAKSSETPVLYIIDGSSYIFRAYHAITANLTDPRGRTVNAVYGFAGMLEKLIADKQADHIVVAFDSPEDTWRKKKYPSYKANRGDPPEDLSPQFPIVKEVLDAYGVTTLEAGGYEADDIIATLVERERETYRIVIVSSDKDLCQLVDDRVTMLDTMKDKETGPAEVAERFGGREAVVEVQGLAGDSSDNLPGIPGVGEKTARDLIDKYGTIEEVLKHIDDISGAKRKENLKEFGKQALLCRELATLSRDVPLEYGDKDLELPAPDATTLLAVFKQLGFRRFIEKYAGGAEDAAPSDASHSLVLTESDWTKLLTKLKKAKEISLDLETTSQYPRFAEIVGISFAVTEGEAFYVPVAHRYLGAPDQLSRDAVLADLKSLLADSKRPKIGQNLLYEYVVFQNYGLDFRGIAFDTMLASYVLQSSRRQHNLAALAQEYLGHTMTSYTELTGAGKNQVTFDEVDVDRAGAYSCDDADTTLRLAHILRPRIQEGDHFARLYFELELPLVEVLGDMEFTGVKLDTKILGEISKDIDKAAGALEKDIFEIAGEKFNINSPKQLEHILFDKLALPSQKKTKTGRSTSVSVLEALAPVHPLPAKILEWRSLTKLKGTYCDALPQLVHPETKRIHTSYNQTVASTGRLSSSDPNLQNIPIRTDMGRRIREAFVPGPGCVFVSADYSQVELRLLAHYSEDPVLLESFAQDLDIHARTASEVFGVELDDVDHDMRRRAKTINFGIIYGMGAYGLSQQLQIPVGEAKEFIDTYFARLPRVREYQETILERARTEEYVTTLWGRRIPVPEINSKTPPRKQAAERAAINAPLQGSAADIIKAAMISLHARLKTEKLKSRMLLQVHDELVLEAPQGEVEEVTAMTREEMEAVGSRLPGHKGDATFELRVPLKVDVGTGSNWLEAH